jgi:hypothetical protein
MSIPEFSITFFLRAVTEARGTERRRRWRAAAIGSQFRHFAAARCRRRSGVERTGVPDKKKNMVFTLSWTVRAKRVPLRHHGPRPRGLEVLLLKLLNHFFREGIRLSVALKVGGIDA